ncbi:uncharacterized protein LOC111088569 [Limulus polyphemus]|uniref:Uncharacterized protein LOC111088569 n=1 Tax=Limulus polyphemus TaxID=6850 RepID=A0ABM1TFY4_LIMPO|nr:uncharacterized protein LOC111088569 [Limulus polyphemus]
MDLRVEFLLLLTFSICSYSAEQPGEGGEEPETTRKARQFVVGSYPTAYLQYYSQQPASSNTVYNYYKRPSLTERFKTFMSKLFGRRSYVQQPYVTPQIQYYYKPYTTGNQLNIPIPQDQNHYNLINPQLSNSLYSPQVGEYESVAVNGNSQSYELNSLNQPGISDSEFNQLNSGTYVDFEQPPRKSSVSEPIRFPSNSQYYRARTYPVQDSYSSGSEDVSSSQSHRTGIYPVQDSYSSGSEDVSSSQSHRTGIYPVQDSYSSGSEDVSSSQSHRAGTYPVQDSYSSDSDDVPSSQSHNAYVSTYKSSSLDFSPVAVPSIANHSPVYKNPGVSGLEKKSYTGNPVYEN